MIWSLVIVGVGQLLVALVFSEIVAQYPVAGGVYPWARRLWGRRWAWMTGWVYLVALLVTIAAVTYGGGSYVAPCFGIEATTTNVILCALAILVIATVINFMGTKVLAQAAIIGFTAEIIGALAVGGWLLLAHREQSLSVLFDTLRHRGRRQLPPGLRGGRPDRRLPVLRLRGLRRRRRGGPRPGPPDPQGDAAHHLHRRRSRHLRLPGADPGRRRHPAPSSPARTPTRWAPCSSTPSVPRAPRSSSSWC